MTNTEIALLGLLTEGPKHGYQLEQDIEMRGMREWTEIGFSSIYYLLKKAETAGWVTVEVHADTNRPARKVFSLTEAGIQVLHDAVYQRLAQPRYRSGDMDLALSYLQMLDKAEIQQAVETYKQHLAGRLEFVQQKWQLDHAAGIPVNVEWLFDYSVTNIRNELEWIIRFQENAGEMNGNIDGELK